MRLIIETIIRHGILNVEIMILQTGLPDQLIADQQGKTLARNTVAVQKTAFHPALIDAQLRCQFLDRKHAFASDDDFSGSVNHWRNGVFKSWQRPKSENEFQSSARPDALHHFWK